MDDAERFYKDFVTNYKNGNLIAVADKTLDMIKLHQHVSTDRQIELLSYALISCKSVSGVKRAKYFKLICAKYTIVINSVRSPTEAIQSVINLENVTVERSMDASTIDKLIDTAFDVIEGFKPDKNHQKLLNRMIVVLTEVESQMARKDPTLVRFVKTMRAINVFSESVNDERKSSWPEYLVCAVKALESRQSDDRPDELVNNLWKKVKCLADGKMPYRKDIAIMISQMINAGAPLISQRPVKVMETMYTIIGKLYDIIREKAASTAEFILVKTHMAGCCTLTNTHAALRVLEASRLILTGAMDRNCFNEVVVSAMSNFAVAEAQIFRHFDCKYRSLMMDSMRTSMVNVALNIDRILTKCGLDRAKRTLQKFASTNVDPRFSGDLAKLNGTIEQTVPVVSDDKKTTLSAAKIDSVWHKENEVIVSNAKNLLRTTNAKGKLHYIYKIHEAQKDVDADKFLTILSIVTLCRSQTNADELQFMEMETAIHYPILPYGCMKKLVDEMHKVKLTGSFETSYGHLFRSACSYLEVKMEYHRYKSNVKYSQYAHPLNEEFVSLKNEIEVVEKLQESLGHFDRFLDDRAHWLDMPDRSHYITFAERMLQEIGENLMNRRYKERAIKAFELLYRFAKLLDDRSKSKEILSAGYLIENMQHNTTIPEEEIATGLQRNIMEKLRDVDTMASDEFGSLMFSFLQLTMYTIRCQHNIEHAKKYMHAINKLLNKYDSDQQKYLAARLKYAEVMFEVIVRDDNSFITPISFIEDILHRFKSVSQIQTAPGIVFDLMSTLYSFTLPRYEFCKMSKFFSLVHFSSVRNGFLNLFAKTSILTTNEHISQYLDKELEDSMQHLDTVFGSKMPTIKKSTGAKNSTKISSESDAVEKMPWNKDIATLLHPDGCVCFQCSSNDLNLLSMEAAAVKARAMHFEKDYTKSLESFQQIYNHWPPSTNTSYSCMLMNYSNSLRSNRQDELSKCVLNEALDVCNDYAQAQDIIARLFFQSLQPSSDVARPSYENEVRPKVAKPKKKAQPTKRVYKKTNIRN